MSSTCACGNRKREEYEECFDCGKSKLKENGELCPQCGGRKKSEKPACFKCALEEARANGTVCTKCDNGILTDPERHKECYRCFKQQKEYDR